MSPVLGIFNLGGGEIFLILAVVLILFGAKKVPELMGGLGKGIKEFKKATREVTDELQSAMEEQPPTPKRIPAETVSHEVSHEEPATAQPSSPSPKA